MNEIKIFLLDLSPLPDRRNMLREILHRAIKRHIQFQEKCVGVREDAPSDNAFLTSLFDFAPGMIFLVLSTMQMERIRAFVEAVARKHVKIPIIAVIDDSNHDDMVALLSLGIVDFITPPITADAVLPRIWRLMAHLEKGKTITEKLKQDIGLKQIIGASPVMKAEIQKIPFVAGCDSSVLISGETGTGKEMFARAIHYLGPRSGKPFVPVNCGAIPAELIENELFGHVRGAFTSAATSQDGIIRESDGGTLFLDEIDCLPPSAQVKLLRFLQEKEYRRLGSAKVQRADVRIIAATNCNLDHAVRSGTFRRDLFYRLNIISFGLPALRERREDIPLLTHYFVDHYSMEFNKKIDGIAPGAEQKLLLHDWPGNVRELQNVIERAMVFSPGGILPADHIHLPGAKTAAPIEFFQEAKARAVAQFEQGYIRSLLVSHNGNITQAARTAGKNRRAFWELIRKYEIDVRQFRSTI